MKVLLILVDGMRPDGLEDIPFARKLLETASYSLRAQTVFPSVTLPCHMSLFHSVDPSRHGITTNFFMPQVRPVKGLCEQLYYQKQKRCAFFYNWEELRDLSRPTSLAYSYFISESQHGGEASNARVAAAARDYLTESAPDFAFVYLGWVDEQGHATGWMGEEYHNAVRESWKEIERIMGTLSEEYVTVITADHGGHDRSHGTEMQEDMTIPVFFHGGPFAAGKELSDVTIKDIAPTVAKLLDVDPAPEWEGKSLV